MNFGSHSKSHPNFVNFGKRNATIFFKKLNSEVFESAEVLEKKLGIKDDDYAYPYGVFDPVIENVVRQRYSVIFTTNGGPDTIDTDPCRLNRYIIFKKNGLAKIEEYLNTEPLPVLETVPENGGYLKKDKILTFFFKNSEEVKKYKDYYIDISGYAYKVKISDNTVYYNLSKLKYHILTMSLHAQDESGKKYIWTTIVNF